MFDVDLVDDIVDLFVAIVVDLHSLLRKSEMEYKGMFFEEGDVLLKIHSLLYSLSKISVYASLWIRQRFLYEPTMLILRRDSYKENDVPVPDNTPSC